LLKQIVLHPFFALDAQPKRGLRLVHRVHGFRHLIPTPRLRFLPGRWRNSGNHGFDGHILIGRDRPSHVIRLQLIDQRRLIRRTVGKFQDRCRVCLSS